MVFTDLEIVEDFTISENIVRKYLLSFSALMGVGIGILLEFIDFETTKWFYIIFAFISGVILYSIVREIMPEKEKGRPLYFLIGFIGFSILIFIINIFIHIV